ncbi:unnamed protein product [Darwinula stevensoni]|uniref:Uncharacterized protein n=1 Tax=Darwinula stevensoni TaxID=69355 RepID=A0A7R8XHW5_9CRUS|nr:unnamed protein product [Darwinula stevensoni]CAG0893254.1 unnamed protein product [Darwinula stevensoni]
MRRLAKKNSASSRRGGIPCPDRNRFRLNCGHAPSLRRTWKNAGERHLRNRCDRQDWDRKRERPWQCRGHLSC